MLTRFAITRDARPLLRALDWVQRRPGAQDSQDGLALGRLTSVAPATRTPARAHRGATASGPLGRARCSLPVLASLGLFALVATIWTHSADAQVAPPGISQCQAIAHAIPGAGVHFASYTSQQPPRPTPVDAAYEVEISYVGHSSFRIVAPDGTVIVTDYAGRHGFGPLPDVVTMNRAHISHWTPNPDPGIDHVLRGWNPEGGAADHFLTVDEVLVRNIPTDIRSYSGVEENGNSIFVFEIAGLCIGHLGHLHQVPTDNQYAQIGRLDLVFVPIDGTYTMDHAAMMSVVERLRASLAIPMHWFSQFTLADFVTRTGDDGLQVEIRSDPTVRVSLNTLPQQPTLMVLPRELGF